MARSNSSIKAPGGGPTTPQVPLNPSQAGDPAVVADRWNYANRYHWLMRQLRKNKSTGLKP